MHTTNSRKKFVTAAFVAIAGAVALTGFNRRSQALSQIMKRWRVTSPMRSATTTRKSGAKRQVSIVRDRRTL
jgi:hypothetical protein